MKSVDWVAVAGGGLILLICGGFFALSFQYEMGSLQRMRPGLFPAILGGAGMLIGAALILQGILAREPSELHERPPLRALICTLIALAGFALLIRPAGLLPAVLVASAVAAFGDRENGPLAVVAISLTACALIWAIFVLALGLPIPLIRGVL